MKYCVKCMQTDTRPKFTFTSDGIYPACEYFAKYRQVDWDERTRILLELADEYRNPSAQYDCVIGVNGGKDSFRQSLWFLVGAKSIAYSQRKDIGARSESHNIRRSVCLGFGQRGWRGTSTIKCQLNV